MTSGWIDVSVGVGTSSLPTWPGSPGASLSTLMSRAAGDPANASLLTMDVHTGTHVDAPRHFVDGGACVEALDLDVLNGEAFVAAVPDVLAIGPEDLDRANVPDGTRRLLLRTANSEDPSLYRSPFREEYAALTPAGARWVTQRGITVVGVDYLSVQLFHDPPDTHEILLGDGVVIIEGLDLRDTPLGVHELICMPVLLVGAEAAPARVMLRPIDQED